MNILFSCQNNEELQDLALLSSSLARDGHTTVLYNTSNITGDQFDQDLIAKFQRDVLGLKLNKKKFSQLSATRKIATAMLNAINIIFICWRMRCDTFVIGVPLLPYRLVSFLSFGKIQLVSYIRGIVASSGKTTSLSSRLFFFAPWMCRGPFLRIVCDYYADKVVCIGSTTKDFLLSRKVPEKQTVVIGSMYCDSRLAEIQDIKRASKKATIVFISSAFAAHGYHESQRKQSELITEILNYVNEKYDSQKPNFIVRKHPRECGSIYEPLARIGADIDTRNQDT